MPALKEYADSQPEPRRSAQIFLLVRSILHAMPALTSAINIVKNMIRYKKTDETTMMLFKKTQRERRREKYISQLRDRLGDKFVEPPVENESKLRYLDGQFFSPLNAMEKILSAKISPYNIADKTAVAGSWESPPVNLLARPEEIDTYAKEDVTEVLRNNISKYWCEYYFKSARSKNSMLSACCNGWLMFKKAFKMNVGEVESSDGEY